MVVGNNISYDAVNEAYCLLSSWLREEQILADYNKEKVLECARFLAEILKHPDNFVTQDEDDYTTDSDSN